MKDSLKVGLSGEHTYVVTDDMSPPHIPAKVLSTPSMIGLIEGTHKRVVVNASRFG